MEALGDGGDGVAGAQEAEDLELAIGEDLVGLAVGGGGIEGGGQALGEGAPRGGLLHPLESKLRGRGARTRDDRAHPIASPDSPCAVFSQ